MEGIVYCACSRSGACFNEAEQTVAFTLEPTPDGREMIVSEVGNKDYKNTYTYVISSKCPNCGASRQFMIKVD